MRRIAILAPYVGTVNRGAETFVIELTKKLSANYAVDVYTLQVEELIRDNIIQVNVKKNHILSLHQKIYNNSSLYRRLVNRCYYLIPDVMFQRKFTDSAFKIINSKSYDLIYPNNGIWGAIYSEKYRKNNRTPYIYTGHGGIGVGEKIIIEHNPNAYVCLTKKHLSWANSIKPQAVKTQLIPNGVNVSSFEKHTYHDSHVKKILSVAALTNFKRHELTIRAVSKLKDVELLILGKGEEEKKLRTLANQLLPGRCEITSTSYQIIKEYYKNSDLFVLPSLEEPFGIVYLEAMASNLAIVAPDDTQRREIIAQAGLFCDVENIDEYAQTISEALDRNWGNIPRKRAEMYDWGIISDEYIDLIESIIYEGIQTGK